MKHTTLPSVAAALLLALSAAQTAQAQPRTVSRDELRVCMDSESSIAARRKVLEAMKDANRAEADAIKAEAAEMTAEQEKMAEEPSERKERAFKRKVNAHNERVKAANAKLEEFRAQAEELNKSAIAYNDKCGGISFLTEDKEAILKERAAAGK